MSRRDLVVRLLRQEDADVLGPLHNRLWRLAYAGLVPDELLAGLDDAATIEKWRLRGREHESSGASAQGAVTHVATLDGVPIGHAAVGPARDEDAPAPIEVWSLYVAHEHWGSGTADVLLDTVLADGPAYLYVLAGNERALRYYRKRGFDLDGTGQPLADTGCHELRMVRP